MLGMLISILILALLLYVSYYDINKEAKKENWIVKNDIGINRHIPLNKSGRRNKTIVR